MHGIVIKSRWSGARPGPAQPLDTRIGNPPAPGPRRPGGLTTGRVCAPWTPSGRHMWFYDRGAVRHGAVAVGGCRFRRANERNGGQMRRMKGSVDHRTGRRRGGKSQATATLDPNFRPQL